jgi:hypothetical protein
MIFLLRTVTHPKDSCNDRIPLDARSGCCEVQRQGGNAVPDVGQVRIAAYRVLREFGLAGMTIKRVRLQMKANGVRPGSDRDLPHMVKAFKAEQGAIAQLPPAVIKFAERFATEIWQFALATVAEIELQRGGAGPEPKKIRKRAQPPLRGSGRITVLQRAVEFLLRPDAKGDKLVRAPISATEIFRGLSDRQAELTDEDRFGRDLLEIQKRSELVYRLPGKQGKWWRCDRDRPPRFGDGKVVKRYVPIGTPLSQTRTGNRPLIEQAIAFMIKSRRPVSSQEIINDLGVAPEHRADFRQMLRNHLRAKNPRFDRDQNGNFVAKRERWGG